jgi:putative tricarboxylic transport membrane protein
MIETITSLATPEALGLILLGTLAGVVVGAIPGLTGAMLIALTLPLTFEMSPNHAMMLLVAMYVGSVSGGLISATLMRMPGTPASIMTTLDGYPLAQSGQPGRALGLGISASLVGGLISWGFLVLLTAPMAALSIRMSPFDFFSLVLVALVLIASVGDKSLVCGLFSGMLGILATIPGTNPATGTPRYTLGVDALSDGLSLLPVLIGLFAVNQLIREVARSRDMAEPLGLSRRGLVLGPREYKQHAVNLTRSSVVGTWVGILPGIGANIGSAIAYIIAKRFSKHPEQFGKGSEEGIIASESANNATVGGALIPLIAMGIPGSVIDAILLGALVLHGLRPGPQLLANESGLVYTIMGAMLLANLLMYLIMLVLVAPLSRLAHVPRAYLVPVVMVFCVIGSFALGNRMLDVWVMLAFGAIGLMMDRGGIPLAPFVIGFVLAPVAEKHLATGLMISDGSYLPLITSPISAIFLIVSVGLLILPALRRRPNTPIALPEIDHD